MSSKWYIKHKWGDSPSFSWPDYMAMKGSKASKIKIVRWAPVVDLSHSFLQNHFLFLLSPILCPKRLTCMDFLKGLPCPLASSWVAANWGWEEYISRRLKGHQNIISLAPSMTYIYPYVPCPIREPSPYNYPLWILETIPSLCPFRPRDGNSCCLAQITALSPLSFSESYPYLCR